MEVTVFGVEVAPQKSDQFTATQPRAQLKIEHRKYTTAVGFCEDYHEIKDVIWAAGPGNAGFAALGEIMNGEVNPSGRTNDTFVYKMSEAPYFNNAEKYDYANMTHMTVDGILILGGAYLYKNSK